MFTYISSSKYQGLKKLKQVNKLKIGLNYFSKSFKIGHNRDPKKAQDTKIGQLPKMQIVDNNRIQ